MTFLTARDIHFYLYSFAIEIGGVILLAAILYADRKLREHGFKRSERNSSAAFRSREIPPWTENVSPLEYARNLYRSMGLPSTLFVADRTLKPESSSATWLGKVVVGKRGESWPEMDGVPLYGVCQLNLEEAEYVPDCLQDFSLIAFFAIGDKKRPDFMMPGWAGRWEIRAYSKNDDLVPYEFPPWPHPYWKPCRARARSFTDHYRSGAAFLEDNNTSLPEFWVDVIDDYIREVLEPEFARKQGLPNEAQWGTKLGGWPAPIQEDLGRPVAFQLGCENAAGINWVDGGCVYVWQKDGHWEVRSECY